MTCGTNAWYAQTCTQMLPVRNVKNVLIMPGLKYCKSRKTTVSTALAGELNSVQPSKKCARA